MNDKTNATIYIPIKIQGFFVDSVYYDYHNTYLGPPHDHIADTEQIQEYINYGRKVCASADGRNTLTPRITHMISPLLLQAETGEIYQITNLIIKE